MIQYRGLGLDNVWLENGYRWEKTGYGDGLVVGQAETLEAAIALHLSTQERRLTGQAFRVLRETLDLTQAEFGARCGRDYQTVARWELASHKAVPLYSDVMIRQFYLEMVGHRPSFTDMAERVAHLSGKAADETRINVRRAADGTWRLDEAVALMDA
ncbi:MAG: hypothetical protein EXR07_16845 [Acetobacteraceae bacterium]|nr:hypothetical protein [Acetobacteraceae bacterium]